MLLSVQFDFRYEDTVRFNFNQPIGLGSDYCNEEEIDPEEILHINMNNKKTLRTRVINSLTDERNYLDSLISSKPNIEETRSDISEYQFYIDKFEKVNKIIRDNLNQIRLNKKEELILDWRDASEIEVSRIDTELLTDIIIQKIEYKLQCLLNRKEKIK